jgi:hypothetical protein
MLLLMCGRYRLTRVEKLAGRFDIEPVPYGHLELLPDVDYGVSGLNSSGR